MNLHLTCTILKVGITLAVDGYHVAVLWYTAFKPEGCSMTTTKRGGMLRVKNVHVAPKFSDTLTLSPPGGADSAHHRRGRI